ncbi:hypothetical protein [Waddlia chondrophila]|uniref:Putative cysteine-rich outer membrane protein n=1 Tax=Waddlia chondrophila (strain ATCC VR-1470 / WSU 86-1044) TaxID=716544 RepID=D6YWK6_WADCW|nr:hypothetical protein [Waddlia chondrophila]ADI38517.1 putative cysteine-rich outer membrane protein [Waddlia chondrophila WSU 86-1044]
MKFLGSILALAVTAFALSSCGCCDPCGDPCCDPCPKPCDPCERGCY